MPWWLWAKRPLRFYFSLISCTTREKHTSLRKGYESECLAKTFSTKVAQNHRMGWVGRDLSRPSNPTPLQWAGPSSPGSGCTEPCPTWPGMFPGMGHRPPLWATCVRVSPPSWLKISSLYPVWIYSLLVKNHHPLSCHNRPCYKIIHSLSCFSQKKEKPIMLLKKPINNLPNFWSTLSKHFSISDTYFLGKGKGERKKERGKGKPPFHAFFQSGSRRPDPTAKKCNESASLFLKPGLVALLISSPRRWQRFK